MRQFLRAVKERGTIVASTKVALVVGSILGLVNYGDRVFLRGDMGTLDWVKLAVSYCVPFCVATYGAARYATRHSDGGRGRGIKKMS